MRPPGPPGPPDADDPLAETTLSSETVFSGYFFEIRRDRVRCADGHEGVREYMHHPGAVMIVAMLDADTVLLERQYRYALRRSVIEMPAGKLEPDEAPLACAQRELREETGYRAARWDLLGRFNNAIGYCDEVIHVYLARELEQVGSAADPGEVLEVFPAPWREVLEWIDEGEITDVKTIIGAGWLERRLRKEAEV